VSNPNKIMNQFNHFWSICEMCGPMVVCGKCGNNCCNGGYGEIIGPEKNADGEIIMIQCDACPSAYEKQDLEYAEHNDGNIK
jgi:hypothetical protein